jgi:hypothetical protein
MAVGDVDGNGTADLVIACPQTQTIDVIRTGTASSTDLPLHLTLVSTSRSSLPLAETFTARADASWESLFEPTGAVLFSFADRLISIVDLGGAEGVIGTIMALRKGSQAVSASYGGDGVYARVAAPSSLSVDVASGTVEVSWSVDSETPYLGRPFRLRGRIFTRISPDLPQPTGTITIRIDGVPYTTAAPDFDLEFPALSPGSHASGFSYSGDANYEPYSQSLQLFAANPPARLVLTATSANGAAEGEVTLTASLPDDPTFSGIANFLIVGEFVSAPVVDGKATYTTTLPVGTYVLHAELGANSKYSVTATDIVYFVGKHSKRRAVR